jgi:amino acid adenylation domain-containing protein
MVNLSIATSCTALALIFSDKFHGRTPVAVQPEPIPLERQRLYWLNRDPQPVVRNSLIELLSLRPRQTLARLVATREWRFSDRVTNDILRVCKDSDLSLYILLVTMFKAVTARSTGQAAVTILSPSFCPDGVASKANMVMLQDQVQFSEDIRSNVLETRRTVVGAYSNQAITLADIHGPRLAEEIISNNPLCALTNIHFVDAIRRRPLEVMFTRKGREISCCVTYDSARLRADIVDEYCSNLQQFTEAASSDYAVPVAAVDWLRGERLKRVSTFSRGPVVGTPDVSLTELFSVQARKTPGEHAIVHGTRTVTYTELEAMADVAARNLKKMGLESGDTIALQLRSGIDAVTIMLAALKAGAAFAPISPNEPPKRLSRLLEKARPKLLVTMQGEPDVVAGVRAVGMPRLLVPHGTALAEVEAPAAQTTAPAYVIFTSGTSGEPKGVVVQHNGILNAVAWKIREYTFSRGHRVLPLFAYEFDGFILNVFAPLCSGATVILMDDEERRLPRCIAAYIESQHVTHVVATPLLYRGVLDHTDQDQLRSLRRVTLAGEAADPETIARSNRLAPHVRLSNEYGPTEGSVVSTCWNDLSLDCVNVIGRPIDNVNVYIFDERRTLVPPGVVGEIFLGGRGLARGYVADDAIAPESFIYSGGERLYQTGDLGRWLPDGNIEFRGRREGYVKVLGQRVDLKEIQAAILRSPGIKDAIVLYLGNTNASMLCACVVVDSQTSVEGIEAFLREELPPHMIPNRFVTLERLPLNSGGKVDVVTLQAKLREEIEERRLPSNDIERRLVQIWRKVLDTEHVGIDDSFFSLGGHSLKAVRLLTDIHEVFGVELPLNQVFSAKTVRRLAEIVALRKREHPEPSSQAFNEGNPNGDFALSSAQERMVALTDEHRLSYNLPVLFALDANLDVPHLQSALHAVLDRHESLRASFRFVNDKWVQRFSDTLTANITQQALMRDADIEEAARSALTPFDLEQAPLFRVLLFAIEEKHAYLLFDFHHIIIDEVSLAIILGELAVFYNGATVDRASPHSYAAYATTQQRRRSSEDYRAQLEAAAEKLRGEGLEPLRLPFDFPAPRKRSHGGDLVRKELSQEIMAAVRLICDGSQVTEFMFFMAVFGLLLNRYTHQSTMIIGAPVSLRSNASTRDLVGLCLNTVPFKIVIPSETTFREYLQGVAAGIIDDLGRSHVEFDDIVKALQLERHFGENPLFSVMLNVIDSSATKLCFDKTGATYLNIHNGMSKFDLILELDLADHKSGFSIEFATERFRKATIQRLSDGLITLLKDIVAKPDALVSALQVVTPTERQRLLEWGGCSRLETYEEGSLSSLFEQRALERPSDVALVFGNDTLTYGDLNARSNRLAHRLQSLGCCEDEVVAVFCERSPAAIIGIMAVQKAGAAHLPLDPFYPPVRTSKMLLDSGARVLITDQDTTALHFAGTVLRTDSDLSDFSSANLGLSRRPGSLAYVLYTSGTTGGPKGVMVAQRNVVTLVHRATSQLSIDHRDVWTLFHSLCFDVSVWEMFGSLISGSRLVIVPREIAADPDRVLNLIEKNAVTIVCQPPSAFYLLSDAMVRAARATSLRNVILGGEAVKMEHLKEWREIYPTTLINGYGITETTVYSTFKAITEEDINQRTASIGRPLSGTYVYILSPDLSPCPIGVTGELYIGGLGVGCGYLGQPELTRSRFVDDPFKSGSLLYRSGDLVRWLPNGEIEYVCRADTQVKVRGYRIELPEIEAAMTAYSAIRESVVLDEAHGSTTQLIGFFTSGIQEDLAELRTHLEDQLPNYMVPARLVQIDQIPMTPNGKIDRAKLLSERYIAPERARRSPTSAVEHVLSKTWAEILGIPTDEIGAGDSFFALGGDSIGANLVVRLLANQGLPVELQDLFENPILGALAEVICLRSPAGSNETIAMAARRAAYWDEIAATKVAKLPGVNPGSTADAQALLKTTVHFPIGDLRSRLATAEDTFELRDVLLTALGVSLRMWSGIGAFRIGLLESPTEDGRWNDCERSLLVAPLVVVIKDLNLGRQNLASVRACIRRAANHRLDCHEAATNPAYKTAIEGGVLFQFRDVVILETTSQSGSFDPFKREHRSIALDSLARGCMVVDCYVSESSAALTFIVPAGATDAERLDFLAEAFKLAFFETIRAVPSAPSPLAKAQISLAVQPFNDVFFKDCTHQAMLAAVRYFGRDVNTFLANTIAVCRRDVGRARGLRLCMTYLERQALEELLTNAGIAVHRSSGTSDVCEDLLESLSQGAVGIVKVDCYFVQGQRELFQRKHGDKTILICGYDRDRRLFEIIDNDAGRFMRYRRTTIGFDELCAAYEGYQRTFNPRGVEVSNFTVFAKPWRQEDRVDEAATRRDALETLRFAGKWRDEERGALELLNEDFYAASASERLLMEHVEQLSFTFGELISGKRLLAYQLGRILKDSQLCQPVEEMISRLEIVYDLLAKMRISQDYAARKVHSMQTKLKEARQLDLEYGESVRRLLETV